MQHLRLSPTLIENYRRWLTEEDMPEQRIIDRVMNVQLVSNYAEYGKAFHAILEEPERYRHENVPAINVHRGKAKLPPSTVYVANGYAFGADVVEPALHYVNHVGLNEVSGSKPFRLADGTTVVIAGRVDQIYGNEVVEYKTKWGEFDIEPYQDSMQWRLYMLVFGVARVTYKIFEMRERTRKSPWADHPDFELVRIHCPSFDAYEACYDDCLRWIESCVAWIRARDLEHYVRREGLTHAY